MTTVLIIPGWQDSGPRHWQSLWQRELPNARRVEQRDWQRPVLREWTSSLDACVLAAPSDVVLVAHSIGCITVAHWASQASDEKLRKVSGAMLVAPADVERPEVAEELRNFAPVPHSRMPFRSLVAASSDDPYCPLERAQQFARAWGSEFANVGPKGHINADAGYGDWPQGEELLNELMRGVRA